MPELRKEGEKPNCFVIMPISDTHPYDPGHFGRVYEHLLKPAILAAGYAPVRADDTTKTDYIVVGVIQKITESCMVLCDLSGRNPNVMYELGVRHAFNKHVVLIKDRRTDKCFDIQGLRYVEYDESLRIATVQKDISRIQSSITETASAGPDDMNSIVRLAGIKTAEVPAAQTISQDTALILSSIAALEKQIDARSDSDRQPGSFFTFNDSNVTLRDDSQAELGDRIYDGKSNFIGELVDIHPADGKIFIRQDNGKVLVFSSNSIRSRDLTVLPF